MGISLIAILFASAAAASWPDPIAHDVIPYQTAGLTHGPMLGRPTAHSVRVWVRTAQPTAFEVVFDARLPLRPESPAVAGTTTAEADNTGVVDLVKLEPGTRYYYGVRIEGRLADTRPEFDEPWPSFRTLPDASTCVDREHNPRGLWNVCFAIGHCASQDPVNSGGQYTNPPVYRTIRREHAGEVQFAIVNGDVIYEELRDGTLEGIRANHRLYFDRGRSFAALLRNVPGLFTFDDHDVGWDLHGSGEIGLGSGPHLMRDPGLTAYQEYLGWANFSGAQSGRVRLGKAQLKAGSDVLVDPQADFGPLRPETVSTIHVGPYTKAGRSNKRDGRAPPNAGVYGLVEVLDKNRLRVRPEFRFDAEVDYSIGTHHWYDWKVANCHFFALDTRGERSRFNQEDRRDPSAFALGPAQRQWLIDGVTKTDAQFIFLVSPDPWVIYHTAAHVSKLPGADRDDKGDGFPSFVHERELLLDCFDRLGKPVVIFTGDVHHSACVRISDNVWEMLCGPLASTGHPLATLGNPPAGGWWDSQGRQVQIRWLAGFPNNLPYERIRNTFYAVVQVNNVAPAGRPEGSGYQWIAYAEPQVIVRWHDGYTGRLVYAETVSTMDAKK